MESDSSRRIEALLGSSVEFVFSENFPWEDSPVAVVLPYGLMAQGVHLLKTAPIWFTLGSSALEDESFSIIHQDSARANQPFKRQIYKSITLSVLSTHPRLPSAVGISIHQVWSWPSWLCQVSLNAISLLILVPPPHCLSLPFELTKCQLAKGPLHILLPLPGTWSLFSPPHLSIIISVVIFSMEAFSNLSDWVKFTMYVFSLHYVLLHSHINHSCTYAFVWVTFWLKTISPSRFQPLLGRSHLYLCSLWYPRICHSAWPLTDAQ